MSEAGANIGKMYQQGLGALGGSLAEGIKAYNENSAKSEAANAKIQMLSQAYADKIAMYSKDPEIAQSGILDSLMAKAQMLQDAPTKGLSQRVMLAHDAETSLSGFGNQLQEWSFLRGREMERLAQQGLNQYSGVKSVTDPKFAGKGDFELDLNKTLQQNKDDALAYLNRIRKANPNLEGSDEDFLANLLSGYEQTAAKADPNVVPAAVTSSLLEQIAAEKRLIKSNKESQKTGLVEDFLARDKKSSRADFEKVNSAAADVLKPKEKTPSAIDLEKLGIKKNADTNTETIKARIAELEKQVAENNRNSFFAEPKPVENTAKNVASLGQDWMLGKMAEYSKIDKKTGTARPDFDKMGKDLLAASYASVAMPYIVYRGILGGGDQSQYEKQLIKSDLMQQEIARGGAFSPEIELKLRRQQLEANKNISTNIANSIEPEKKTTIPKLGVEEFVLGSVTKEQKLSVMERQKQVADFITSRMGAIDPTDPERKRRLPVAGFDKFYQSLVPESEIREFTTDSGMRVVHMNGKWEQVKGSEPMSLQDIRKASEGIYGQQDSNGRLIPTEFTEGSGVYIGGIFKGSNAANDKYSEEIANLIDARRGIKKLAEINDRTGEFFSPSAQGEAEVEVMNLSAMLRTDIIGVGTVSNYEQELIKKVIRNPTDFFSLESKDRAILLALAQRVDRRIKSVSAAKGLTVIMKDTNDGNKYQALREQYLREKGIL